MKVSAVSGTTDGSVISPEVVTDFITEQEKKHGQKWFKKPMGEITHKSREEEPKPDYNKTKLWILKAFLSVRGWFRCLGFRKNKRYFGGRNKRNAVYMGKRTFYETIEISGLGYFYWDQKPIKYEWWELGMFKWERR